MKLSDFDFALPDELIALRPSVPRSAARLLVALGGKILDRQVTDLVEFLRPGDRLVLNNTKVVPARLQGVRTRKGAQGEGQANIEVSLLAPAQNGGWMALARPLKRLKRGEKIVFSDALNGRVADIVDGQVRLTFNISGPEFDRALRAAGKMPLPPYIAKRREIDAQDDQDYQTVFADVSGAVAAPTASLHFDAALLERLAKKGVERSFVTLHVGAGTFLPVKVSDISGHKMHSEWGEISKQAAAEITRTFQQGGRVIPVGTTALRLIESAATSPGVVAPWRGETDIFIKPGYKFSVASGLMTNFHLPKSTLMMLVAALMGHDRIKEIYAHAILARYRFYSYGDSSLLLPENENDLSASQ